MRKNKFLIRNRKNGSLFAAAAIFAAALFAGLAFTGCDNPENDFEYSPTDTSTASAGSASGTVSASTATAAEETDPNKCAAPVADRPSGYYLIGDEINFTTATPGASIYYTWDGTDPNESSALYTEPITMGGPAGTIRLIAIKSGMENSDIAAYTYHVAQPAAPTASPPPGEYARGTQITLSCATPGAEIYYDIDNDLDTYQKYTGPITFDPGPGWETCIRAWAKRDDMYTSYSGDLIYNLELEGNVVINGTPEVLQTLSVDTGYLIDVHGQLSYQWKADGVNVGAEHDKFLGTYTVQRSDLGKAITVTVTDDTTHGSKTSEPTSPVVLDPKNKHMSITFEVYNGGEGLHYTYGIVSTQDDTYLVKESKSFATDYTITITVPTSDTYLNIRWEAQPELSGQTYVTGKLAIGATAESHTIILDYNGFGNIATNYLYDVKVWEQSGLYEDSSFEDAWNRAIWN